MACAVLQLLDLNRRRTLRTVFDFKLDALTLSQATEAGRIDSGLVYEDILAAVFRGDKTEPLLVIKPLDRTFELLSHIDRDSKNQQLKTSWRTATTPFKRSQLAFGFFNKFRAFSSACQALITKYLKTSWRMGKPLSAHSRCEAESTWFNREGDCKIVMQNLLLSAGKEL